MDLQFVDQVFESRQYQNRAMLSRTTARDILDHAFIDMISLWILYNEYEMVSVSTKYAQKTIQYSNFKNLRHNSTDLYLTLYVATNKAAELTTASRNDTLLLDRVKLPELEVKRYISAIARNQADQQLARRFLQKFERSLVINDSSYKSIRRLAQDWTNINDTQRSMVITRILQFYRTVAPKSELYYFVKDLAKSKKLEIKNANNAEIPKSKTTSRVAKAAGVGVLGYAAGKAGYKLGKGLV